MNPFDTHRIFSRRGSSYELWPRDFKKFMGWIFLVASLENIYFSARSLPSAFHLIHDVQFPWMLFYAPMYTVFFAVVSGGAWFAIWKGKPWAKLWAIAASCMWIFVFLRQFLIPLHPVWRRNIGALFAGIVGLVAFMRPAERNKFDDPL